MSAERSKVAQIGVGANKLDLIVETDGEKSGQICLLLSSVRKEPGQLVAVVGCQDFSG